MSEPVIDERTASANPLHTLAFVVVALLWIARSAGAQEFSAWSDAANLGAPVNTAAPEGCPFIARSDLTLFVVSTRPGGYGGQDIYVSQRDSAVDPWGPLQNAGPAINTSANELCPTLTIDGHHLLFVSDRAGGCGGQDLYVARRRNKRDDVGWEPPANLGCTVNSAAHDFTPSLFDDEATGRMILYFSSDRPAGMGGVDIYSSSTGADGGFEPAVLVPELSTPYVDERPNVRKDGLEIFFDSDRPGSIGSTDLWVSTRESTTSPWSIPVNLGPAVNTAAVEARPSLSFDGTALYFNSMRPGGRGSSDVYVATRARAHGRRQ
jgi:Tol biopolymer transport system component